MNTERLPFTRRLKALGFYRQDTGRDPLVYLKDMGHRRLDVQLWRDGKHRASHWMLFPGDHRRGHQCTLPTDFATIEQMDAALKAEATRNDHPPQMTFPKRVQLSRTAGWRMPPNTVKADRSTRFGNPYCIGEPIDLKQARRWAWDISPEGKAVVCRCAMEAVRRFTHCLVRDEAFHPFLREHLGGRNIGCWCALDAPCHVDSLLVVANPP
jgi:hypothetical protein